MNILHTEDDRKQAEEGPPDTLAELQRTQEQLRIHNEELQASNLELRQSQEQLETSRQKYSNLYDFAPVGYCSFDTQGLILEANLTIAKLLGVERGLLSNTRFYRFIVEEDRDRFFLHLRTLFETQTRQVCEIRLLTPTGIPFFAQLDSIPSPDRHDDAPQCRTAISNITQRKRMEEELQEYRQHLEKLVEQRTVELKTSHDHLRQEITERQRADQAVQTSEQQYRLLAENVADGIGIIQEGKLVFANDALALMFGYTAGQLVEMDVMTLFRNEDRESFKKRFDRRDHDAVTQDWQAACVSRDGREIWAEFRQRVLEWEGTFAILATVRDISARKVREMAMEKERVHLRRENIQLRSAIEDRSRFGAFVGKSHLMQEVYAQIVTAAAVDANVLISGESGTGKELAATTIHQLSRRKTQEFVAVNCGAIPEHLFESEFFGHRKGAFTGAIKDKPGFFDRAHKGTLFLDEVGELPAAMQVKLLRVIETGEYTPVGDNRSRHVNVRLIAATNKNLETLVKQGGMRDDFFYRIYVLSISMPPLRSHRNDIPLLVEHFLQHDYPDVDDVAKMLPENILEALMQHSWTGNVRELYNVLQRYLQEHRLEFSDTRRIETAQAHPSSESVFKPVRMTFRNAIEAYEKRLISTALKHNHNNTAQAAASLDIPLRTLYRKIEKYHLLSE